MSVDYAALVEKMPQDWGDVRLHYDMRNHSSLGVGGKADIFFQPKNVNSLGKALRFLHLRHVPVFVLGNGSNTLISDYGIEGCVIKLGIGFDHVFCESNVVEVGGAVNVRDLVLRTADQGLTGLEFLVGVPGVVGGAIHMNAGCFGHEIGDYVEAVECLCLDGRFLWLYRDDLSFTYRKNNIPSDCIVTRAWLRCLPDHSENAIHKIRVNIEQRKNRHPINEKSLGSVFRNPLNDDRKAWQLIDQAQCRGLSVGGAKISNKHCNFIVLQEASTAADVLQLMRLVHGNVLRETGIFLETEVVLLGRWSEEDTAFLRPPQEAGKAGCESKVACDEI